VTFASAYAAAIASDGVAVGNSIINIKYALVTARSSIGIALVAARHSLLPPGTRDGC